MAALPRVLFDGNERPQLLFSRHAGSTELNDFEEAWGSLTGISLLSVVGIDTASGETTALYLLCSCVAQTLIQISPRYGCVVKRVSGEEKIPMILFQSLQNSGSTTDSSAVMKIDPSNSRIELKDGTILSHLFLHIWKFHMLEESDLVYDAADHGVSEVLRFDRRNTRNKVY